MTMTMFLALGKLLALVVFGTWTTPRTWVPGELVTASMMNTHVRDNLNSIRSEHFLVGTFRGLHLRSHPDRDQRPTKVQLIRADEVVMSDGTRMSVTTPLTADITASGANGLDTGAEANSTWYEVYLIAKDDGTKALLLHRSLNYAVDATQGSTDSAQALGDAAANSRVAQGFQVTATSYVPFIDVQLVRTGTPSGRVWMEITTDNAGNPSTTVVATSDKLEANAMASNNGYPQRFVFRSLPQLTSATQYHMVLRCDYSTGANYLSVSYLAAGGYASGSLKKADGTPTWSAVGTGDAFFKVWVIQNDTAVTMPTGYTKSCKIGYCYNDSSGNICTFVAHDRFNYYPPSTREILTGASATASPLLTDISAFIPPGRIKVRFIANGDVVGNTFAFNGVPDGVGTSADNYIGTAAAVITTTGVWIPTSSPTPTEYQGIYVHRSTGAGNLTLYTNGWEW